jgi:ABC-type transport system involved in cytochrome bd biosynthesis fused ATPase/permease subunit
MVILDEPTANLDPNAVYLAISNLNKVAKSGTIIFTATHDRKLISATQSVMVIREGGVLTANTKQYLQSLKPKAANAPAQQLRSMGAIA